MTISCKSLMLVCGFCALSMSQTMDARFARVPRRHVHQQTYEQLRTDAAIAVHAMDTIKRGLAQKTGSPFRISCTYRMIGDRPVSATTKVYYIDYRKESETLPDCTFTPQAGDIDRVVEVVYKPSEKKCVTLVDRDPHKKNRRLSDNGRVVRLPNNFSA